MAVITTGVDYAFSHPTIDSLVKGGYTFAVRYLYPNSQAPDTKNLTLNEATVLNAALTNGVVSNFESWASRALDGHDAGVQDAKAAQAQHTACGGKLDRPIYFSVDFDAQPSDYPAVDAYMLGVASVIGLARTGVYGSYSTVKHLLDAGLVTWAWQTYAWSGGAYDERCQLSQDQNGVSLGGGDVDIDTAHAADFGQWNWTENADVTPDECKAAVREVLGISAGGRFAVPIGMTVNDNVLAMLVSMAQGQVNVSKQILAAAAAAAKIDQVWLERVIVAAVGDALAGGIPVDTVTAVVKKAVDDALAASTIPITLTGHAGTPPTP